MLSRFRTSARSLLAGFACLLTLSSAGLSAVWIAPSGGDQPFPFSAYSPAARASANPVSETGAATAARGVAEERADQAQMAGRKSLPVAARTATPVFHSSVARIDGALKQRMLENGIWRADAPVPLDELRVITMSHWDFDGQVQTGRLIVNQAWATQIIGVFKTIFDAHFPIRRMDALNELRRSSASLVAYDNSEGFHPRTVNGGWSMHAHGLAIDINPVENPWVRAGKAAVPTYGAPYAGRPAGVTGLVTPDSVVVKAFKTIGWKWGGEWRSSKDYMHFSSNGH